MHPTDAHRVANSVDPDQTAPSGPVCFGSKLLEQSDFRPTMFAQICLSENLGSI